MSSDIVHLRTLVTECEKSERNGGYNLRADRAILRALPGLLDEIERYRMDDMMSADPDHRSNRKLRERIAQLEAEVERLQVARCDFAEDHKCQQQKS